MANPCALACSNLGAALVIVLFASLARAQPREVPERPGWLLAPSFRVAPVYEDNVLFTPEPLESWLLRITPRLDAFYSRDSSRFEGGYTFDAERYPQEFATLNDAFARQEGYAELRKLLNRRSSLVVRGTFLSTSRADEVLQDSGLLSLRRRSRSIVGNALFTRAVRRRLSWTVGYGASLRDFVVPVGAKPRLGGVMHSLVTGFSLRHSVRTTSGWNYAFRLFVQEDLPELTTPINEFATHVATYRWSRSVSRKTDLVLSLGPRFSDGLRFTEGDNGGFEKVRDVAPEIFASFVYRGDGKFFSAQYNRTQAQAYGLSGFVDSENAIVTVLFEFGPRFRIEANPGIYRNRRAGITTNSYQSNLTVEYEIASWASIESSYIFQYQDRLLAIVDGGVEATDDGITRNTVWFGIRLFDLYAKK